MKRYTMLKTTLGVREGEIHPAKFLEGETYPIDDSLAEQFYHLGVITLAEGEKPSPAVESRETKVIAPEETKVDEPEEVKAPAAATAKKKK